MKRNALPTVFTAAVFAWVLSVCAVGCMVTGLKFDTVDMGPMALLCGAVSVFGAFCFYWKRGGLAVLCAAALALGFLWRGGTAWEQTKLLLYQISTRYDSAYGCGRLDLGITGLTGALGYPLGIIGAVAAVSVSWTVVRRKNVLFVLIPVLGPLISCLVVTDTVPAEGYLYGLMLGLALLVMTDWVRRNGPARDARLTALMAVPVAAALGLLFLATPQGSYVNRAGELEDWLMGWAEQLTTLAQDVSGEVSLGADASGSEQVNLRVLGPRNLWNYSVMKVTAPTGGTVYLRGQDYNTYNGTGWISSENRKETFTQGGESAGRLEIETYGVKSVRYVPYYAAETVTLTGGCVENNDRLKAYSYDLSAQPQTSASPDSMYLQLPAETLRWAREITSRLEGEDTARAIGDYVRSSASYDLDTGRMDGAYSDFAQWFLEESSTGYCVHFATAATVLLRAAGIPARYVEGYMVTCRAGEQTTVTGKMAHAWAEYYDYGTGAWVILEATPAAEQTAEQTGQTQEAPTETAPPPEEETADATLPTRRQTAQTEASPGISREEVPQETRKAELPSWARDTLRALAWIPLGAGLIWGQSAVRLGINRRRWNRGGANRQALARWSQVSRLARVLGTEVPPELEELAQKARYSQHILTEAELEAFGTFRRETLRGIGPWKKWVLRLVFALGEK